MKNPTKTSEILEITYFILVIIQKKLKIASHLWCSSFTVVDPKYDEFCHSIAYDNFDDCWSPNDYHSFSLSNGDMSDSIFPSGPIIENLDFSELLDPSSSFTMMSGFSEISSICPLPSLQKELEMKPITLVLDLDGKNIS